MVRIKFTGPGAALQMQTMLTRNAASKSPATTVQHKSQNEVELRPTVSAPEQLALKQQQSLEMVQIMLHVSIGTLFYLREFLPLSCFDDRDLKQAQRERKFSYREFINGKARSDKNEDNQDVAFGLAKRGQPLKIIVRNSDPKADMLLDVLESGIFDALNKSALEAVQFTILADKDIPSNVLESYTFSFKYTGRPGDVDSRLESLSLDPVDCVADMKSALTARMGLEMIVRRLITLSAFLPTLPNKRSLGIHLFYTEDCPSGYDPPGFEAGDNNLIYFPLTENWRKESQSCGVMNSGSHTVGLKVTSLKWTGPDSESTGSPPKIPQDIEYRDPVSQFADVGFDNEEMVIHSGMSANSGSQETQDITERQKLQMMIPRTSSTPDSDLIPTQPVDHNAKAVIYRKTSPDKSERVILSTNKAAEIRQYLKSDLMGSTLRQDSPVKCQCAWDGEEPEMIECAFCHSRQHVLCYGFHASNDAKIPDTHACYQCLLGQHEVPLLGEMHTLVLLRRALCIILTEGYQNKIPIFAEKLHCNGNTVIQITDILKRRKFIQPTPGYKRKGFPQSGQPKYRVACSDDIHHRIQNEVFDPLAKIGHHYFKEILDRSTGISKVIQQRSNARQDPQDGDIDMDARTPDEQTEESSVGPQTPRMNLRKRKQMLNADLNQSSDVRSMGTKSREPPQKDDALPNLHSTDKNTKRPETPKSRYSSPEGGLRRSSRKRRKISNYKRLIDVGAASSSDEGN